MGNKTNTEIDTVDDNKDHDYQPPPHNHHNHLQIAVKPPTMSPNQLGIRDR